MLLSKIGMNSKMHEPIKINHLEEAICLGLTIRPIKKSIRPIPQAISCLPTETQLKSMNKNGYEFKLNGKKATLKSVLKLIEK